LIKIIIQEENFKWHLEAFASELYIFTKDKYICVYQRDNLTAVSPVYSEDPPVQQRAEELNLLVYSQTDSDLSGVRGLISELKSEQQHLHL